MNDDKTQISLPPIDLLLDYMDGILPPESHKEIEDQLRSSEELSSIVEGIRYYYQTNGYDRGKVNAYIESLSEKGIQIQPPPTRHITSPTYWRVAAVVSLLILGLGTFYLSQQTTDDLIKGELAAIYPAPDVSRGQSDDLQRLWGEVSISYSNRDFLSAEGKLLEIYDQLPSDVSAKFYLGLCNLYQEPAQLSESIRYFQEVVKTQHRLSERAKWFLGLAYYSKGEKDSARKWFLELVNDRGYKWEESQALLEEFD